MNTILSVFTTTAISESEYFNETQVKLNTLSFDKSRIDDMDTQMVSINSNIFSTLINCFTDCGYIASIESSSYRKHISSKEYDNK